MRLADVGLALVSFSITTILRPITSIVPPVAYSRPIMKPMCDLLGVGLERAGLVVDVRDLDFLRLAERAPGGSGKRQRQDNRTYASCFPLL